MRTEKRENNTIGTSDQKTKNKTINKYMMMQTGFIFNAKSCSKYTSGKMAQNVSLIIFFYFLFVCHLLPSCCCYSLQLPFGGFAL